jgi:hypothetical protein
LVIFRAHNSSQSFKVADLSSCSVNATEAEVQPAGQPSLV